MDHLGYLKDISFFKSLPESDIRKLVTACQEEEYAVGDLVFAEGSSGDSFYIILEGEISIWKGYQKPDRDLLAVYQKGQSFGELALIDDFPRSATVVAKTPCRLLSIRRHDFSRVITESSPIALTIMRSISAMIRESTENYVDSLRNKNNELKKAYNRLRKEIGDRRSAEKRLVHGVYHDHLTGLPNKAYFVDRLKSAIAQLRRRPRSGYAVLYLDLDRFKVVNEGLGHIVGDELLIRIAQRLKSCIRKAEILARFGGDEFAVLIGDVRNTRGAIRVARRIEKELQAPFTVDYQEIFVSASIGIVSDIRPYGNADDVLRDAEVAMYRVKGGKQGGYQVYDKLLHRETVELISLETDMRRAWERGEFFVTYQPIVEIESCHIMGFEALMRWLHPSRGLIPPDIFIPIAEESGLILPLGRWILAEACRQLKTWTQQLESETPLFISVNISGRQLMQNDFASQLEKILKETGLAGSALKLEITESILMENIEHLPPMLERLKKLGVQIALDDFGTGYCSLSYLHQFPVDILKIDRSFIWRMNGGQKKDLIALIVSIARTMEMEVVAEGVETPEQFQRLVGYHCEYAQGFYFSKPLKDEEVKRLLGNGNRKLGPLA